MPNKENTPTMDQWEKLYELMDDLKELAPWEYMHEEDIFGFELPDTKEIGFISVMGNFGEHFSVAVYQGVNALNQFIYIEEMGEKLDPRYILQVPQLQASFEDRKFLTDEDRKTIKALGLKFRGKNAWPQFRGFRPDHIPWRIETDEAQLLICALEQVLDVAPRFKENPDLFFPTKDDDDFLFRIQKNGIWQDITWRNPGMDDEPPVSYSISTSALETLKNLIPGKFTIEFDVYIMDEPFQDEKNERPYFPYMMMLADQNSGMILNIELLKPVPNKTTMMQGIPNKLLALLVKFPPREILVADPVLYSILEPIAEYTGCKIKLSKRLPAIQSARREYETFMNMRMR